MATRLGDEKFEIQSKLHLSTITEQNLKVLCLSVVDCDCGKMSGFYTANQFEHSFKPSRLCNYEYGTNPWPGKMTMCSRAKCSTTYFIANDCGHLLPCIPRNPCTSPWGDYALSIWEQTAPCLCISMLRHPHKFISPRQIYVTNEVQKPKSFATQASQQFNDPETKQAMKDDMLSPWCPGRGSSQIPIAGCIMSGDPKAIQKLLREKRRAEKRGRGSGRGARKLITFELGVCGTTSNP